MRDFGDEGQSLTQRSRRQTAFPSAISASKRLSLLRKELLIKRGIPFIRKDRELLLLRNRHVVCRERRAGRALEFRDRLVQIRLSLQLPAAGGEKLGLSL